MRLVFAIHDHPRVDSADGAAVRIAVTVGAARQGEGRLVEVVEEIETGEDAAKVTHTERTGLLHANLAIGANVASTISLLSNERLASIGLILGNRGFVLTRDEAESFKATNAECAKLIASLRNGEDITGKGCAAYVIDTNGWSEEDLRSRVPEIYQRLRDLVYPERQANRDPKLQKYWWLFRRSNEQVRAAIAGLPRFIATVETSKHRIFTFLAAGTKPEHKLVVIGFDDAYFLGVLSSRIHAVWALSRGALLEDRPVYPKSEYFDPFPFPTATKAQQTRIRDLVERLVAHEPARESRHRDTFSLGLVVEPRDQVAIAGESSSGHAPWWSPLRVRGRGRAIEQPKVADGYNPPIVLWAAFREKRGANEPLAQSRRPSLQDRHPWMRVMCQNIPRLPVGTWVYAEE